MASWPAFRLDPIAGSSGDQCRRDHIARDLVPPEGTLQLKPARACFVTTLYRALAAQPLNEAYDRRTVRRQGVQRRRPMAGQ
jgi:hypothetical protein